MYIVHRQYVHYAVKSYQTLLLYSIQLKVRTLRLIK